MEQENKINLYIENGEIAIKEEGLFGSKTKFERNISIANEITDPHVSFNSEEGKPYFSDLILINIMLTNACNLNCSYCYEQHRKDYGTWDVEKIHKVYKFLKETSTYNGEKVIQFFGGEPLIHKKLILEYLRTHKEELDANSNLIKFAIVTNGLLLDQAFIDEYLSYGYTKILISLDTFNTDVDHREIDDKKMERIKTAIRNTAKVTSVTNPRNLVIRCTVSRETAPTLLLFAKELGKMGVTDMIIHPLTMSAELGYIEWTDEEWGQLEIDSSVIIDKLGIEIEFAEGVLPKGNASNCLIGTSMIAVDGTGDYTGCYFLTNLKDAVKPFVLGNVFDDKLYVTRYQNFIKRYNDSLGENDPKCKDCDLNGYCYQCPAGNANTGDRSLFRSDKMCQKIVKLAFKLREAINLKRVTDKGVIIERAFFEEPDKIEDMISKAAQLIHFKRVNNRYPSPSDHFEVDTTLSASSALDILVNGEKTGKDYVVATAYAELANIGIHPNLVAPNNPKTKSDIEHAAMFLTLLHVI